MNIWLLIVNMFNKNKITLNYIKYTINKHKWITIFGGTTSTINACLNPSRHPLNKLWTCILEILVEVPDWIQLWNQLLFWEESGLVEFRLFDGPEILNRREIWWVRCPVHHFQIQRAQELHQRSSLMTRGVVLLKHNLQWWTILQFEVAGFPRVFVCI